MTRTIVSRAWMCILASAMLFAVIPVHRAASEEPEDVSSMVVSIDLSKEYTAGFTIPVTIRVRNTSTVSKEILRPILGSIDEVTDVGNLGLTLERLDTNGVWRAQPRVRASEIGRGLDNTRTKIESGEEKQYGLNLLEYFFLSEGSVGRFRFAATIFTTKESLPREREFSIVPRRPISQETICIRNSFGMGRDPKDKVANHQVLVFGKGDGFELRYGASIRGFGGHILIDEGTQLGGYKMAFTLRDVSQESLYYDIERSIHYNPTYEDRILSETPDLGLSPVRGCAYSAVAYVKEGRLFFWSVGQYFPFSSWVCESTPPPRLFDILCKPRELVPDVLRILSMKADNGLMAIEYLDREEKKGMIKVDEKGMRQE